MNSDITFFSFYLIFFNCINKSIRFSNNKKIEIMIYRFKLQISQKIILYYNFGLLTLTQIILNDRHLKQFYNFFVKTFYKIKSFKSKVLFTKGI